MDLRRYPSPRHRFDAPAGEYPVIYASDEPTTTVAEVYRGRGGRIEQEEAERYLVRLMPMRSLPLVDLRLHENLVALGLDERIGVGDDYAACQAWALAFYRASSDVMGICYRSRLAGAMASNVVVFADRALPYLDAFPEGQLRELEGIVLTAADRFGLTVLFPFA